MISAQGGNAGGDFTINKLRAMNALSLFSSQQPGQYHSEPSQQLMVEITSAPGGQNNGDNFKTITIKVMEPIWKSCPFIFIIYIHRLKLQFFHVFL
jgi:hypothetical protein